MGKRRARLCPPAEKPTLAIKNEIVFTSNLTNRENTLELCGPPNELPNGMHMKGEIIFIVLSSRVVCISLVVYETGMSTRLWIVNSAAAGSIFGVGIISMLIKMISIAQHQYTKFTRDAVSENFLVVPVRIAYLYFNQSFREKVRVTMIACVCFQITRGHVCINKEKWKLPVENSVFRNESGHSVGNPAVTPCTETDSVNSQISFEVYENDLMETDQITFAELHTGENFEHGVILSSSGHLSVVGNNSCKQSVSAEEINIEHVEQDLWKWLHLDKAYGEKTQKNCVGYPSVRSCTERDSVISQTSLEIYENDIMETDQITCAEFPSEGAFKQDVNCNSSGHLSVTGNESCKQNEDGILSEFQIDSSFGNSATLDFPSSDVSTKIGFTKQKICQHILFESTQQEDGSHLNGCSSGYMSVNASCKDRDEITISSSTNQITLAEFPREETFGQDVNSHSSGHLSVTGDESSKQSEEGILSEFQNERSFGNSAILNLPSSDVSKEIGYTKQKICQKILLESTQQEDGTHLNRFSSGYMSEIASCKDRDQITCAEFPREETFGQDVNSHSSGHLSVTGNESSKDNEEGILSELQIKRSFGNSASFDLSISDVSKKIGYTKQKICQKILLESTQLEDGTHLNGCSSGYMSVNSRCKGRAGSKRLDWYSQQSDGKDHSDSRVNENEEDLCSRETIKCQLDRVEEWLKGNDFERMNTDIDDYTGCGEHEFKPFENSITQCNKECKCEKISKDKAITDISCLTRSCSNIKAKSLNKDNDSGQMDSFPDAHPLHDRSKANFHEHYFETHAKIKGNFQTNPLHCISITPKTESILYPQDSQRDSDETKTIASSSRKSNSLQNISNNESKHKIKTSLLDTNPAPLTLPDPFHRDVLVVV